MILPDTGNCPGRIDPNRNGLPMVAPMAGAAANDDAGVLDGRVGTPPPPPLLVVITESLADANDDDDDDDDDDDSEYNTYTITLVLLKLLLQPFDIEAPLHLGRLTDDGLDLLGGRGLHLVPRRPDRSGARGYRLL